MLTPNEQERYDRQIMIGEMGHDGLRVRLTEFSVSKNPNCDHCGSQNKN